MARPTKLVDEIRAAISELESLVPSLSNVASRQTRALLDGVRTKLNQTLSTLDPVKEPAVWFDPADPDTAGRLVAAALLAQPRVRLDLIPRTYGAGVYAIYYCGSHPVYAPISKTETPIYVGKADPALASAKTARDQGQKLFSRLADHRKMIRTVSRYAMENSIENPLNVEDFECRKLVTATNAQMFAERHLIDIFRPVWNKETNVCWGISKHGDTAGRNNDRAPWDVLHPGRPWAMAAKLEDSRPRERILLDIANHFTAHQAFRDRDSIIERFLAAFAQDPMTTTTPVTDDEVPPEDIIDEDAPSV